MLLATRFSVPIGNPLWSGGDEWFRYLRDRLVSFGVKRDHTGQGMVRYGQKQWLARRWVVSGTGLAPVIGIGSQKSPHIPVHALRRMTD